jgi:hypothetical protein
MAVLLVELHGIKRGSVLPRRVLIGRRSMNHLIIGDPGVSRMHAWIDGEGDRYYIHDAGSRTGTRVNGQRIVARHLLGDEDEISIGPAKLTFLAESRLRPGVDPIDLVAPPKIAAAENGIAFECPACTAPLWATLNFAGGTGQCKYCGNEVVVPRPKAFGAPAPAAFVPPASPTVVPPAPPPQAVAAPSLRRNRDGEQICGVCQSAISVFEEQCSCPNCGLVFHADCWTENYGCSAYGCPQVNALAPLATHEHSRNGSAPGPESESSHAQPAYAAAADSELDKPPRFPWEFLLLAGSVFSALVGALTFGLPSLAVAGGTVTYMARTRGNGNAHRGIIILSAGLALLGVIAGVPVSWFLYFGGPHS